jgi:dipeptidyl aminopeptidase/acylaminoacyl peptidase
VSIAITPGLLADRLRVSDPQISPDGRSVVFVVAPMSRKGEHAVSEIWIAESDGERRLTRGPADMNPRFSPDGRYLAFTSDRAKPGTFQLQVMRLDGGEALEITSRKSGVSSPEWSPDGRRLAFLSADETSEEEEKDRKERRDADVVDQDLKTSRLYVVDRDGGDIWQVSAPGPNNVWSFTWAPDSKRLAATVTATPLVRDHWRPTRMMIYDLEGDERLLVRHDRGVTDLKWSPEGDSIAYLGSTGRVGTADQVHLAQVDSGTTRLLVRDYAGSVHSVTWLDGRRLLAAGVENVYGALSILTVGTRTVKVTPALGEERRGTFGEVSVASDGKRLAAIWTDSSHPAEVFTGDLGNQLQRCSHRTEAMSEVDFQPGEVVSWHSSDGTEVYGIVVLPKNGRAFKPLPLVLVIHGGPASAFTDRLSADWHNWAQLLAANGYAVLMPNPRGSTGRGSAFSDANIRDLGGMELQDDLAGVDLLVAQGIADPDRLAVVGWSHGGYMAAWTVTQTDRFKAAVMGAGLVNLISDQGNSDIPDLNLDYFFGSFDELYSAPGPLWERSGLKHITNVKTPTLILHGQNDDRVAPSQGREMYSALTALGVPTTFVTYPREAHGFREREHQIDVQRRIVEWLAKYLG